MKIVKVISDWKKKNGAKKGYKRVQAVVEENGRLSTKHIDIEN